MANNIYRLSVRRGPETGKSFPLIAASLTIGRDPMADIVLTDPEVSRQHARLTRTDSGYNLQDLGSTNGTFVNGKRLSGEPIDLQPGTVITMGSNVTLVFEMTGDSSATALSREGERPESDETVFGAPSEPGQAIFPTPGPQVVPDVSPEVTDMSPEAHDAWESNSFEDEANAVEFPAEAEPETSDVQDEEVRFPSYGESVFEKLDEQQTILEARRTSFTSGDAPEEEEGDVLPSFEEEERPYFAPEPEPAFEPQRGPGDRTPPPPPPPAPPEKGGGRRRIVTVLLVVLLLICSCCGLVIAAWYLGDPVVNMLRPFLEQLQ